MIDKEIIKYIEEKISSLDILPIGAIFAFPSTGIPNGYLPCEGQELSTRQYPQLYALIGNTFGGNQRTFNLPDLQGLFIRGLDREGNIDCDSENIREIGSIQEDSFQGHGHIASGKRTTTDFEGSHQHELYKEEHGGGMGTIFYSVNHDGYANSESCKKGKVKISAAGSHYHSCIPQVEVGEPTNSTYGISRVSSETRPTNMALIFCIKVG